MASSRRSRARCGAATRSSPWPSGRSPSSCGGGRARTWARSRRAASRWRDPSGRRRGRDRHRQQLGAAADRGGGPRAGARAGPAARRARPDGGARRGPGRGACGRGRRPRGERAAVAGARRRRPARRLGRHGDRARRARPRRVRAAPRARTCARPHRARGAHGPPRAHDRRRARGAPGARSRARGDPARRRARAGAGRRRTRRPPDRGERSRRPPCLPARGPRARRPAGRLPGALAMTADELARAIAAGGVRDTARVAEAARAVAGWLARAPADEVAEGLAAAADPAAALDQLARLLPAAAAPPAPGRVTPLLRLLGGSPALAGALVAEGAAWPALVAAVHEVPARGPDAQRAALAVAGASGPLSRADLQAALRRHRRRELVRIGGRDLLGLASVEDTVRELSALAEGVIDAAVASVRARLAAEWGEALVPGEGRPAAFVVLGMGRLGRDV